MWHNVVVWQLTVHLKVPKYRIKIGPPFFDEIKHILESTDIFCKSLYSTELNYKSFNNSNCRFLWF